MPKYIFEKTVTLKIQRTANGCWNVEKPSGGSAFGGKAVPLLFLVGNVLEAEIDGFDQDKDVDEVFNLWKAQGC